MGLCIIIGCGENKTLTNADYMLKPIVIYKTTNDMSQYVPIIMDSEKKNIISYPAISDVSLSKKPTTLKNGYLLDNFGLSVNSAYTSYTIDNYAHLPKQPSIQNLKTNILNLNPIVEMYSCPNGMSYEDLNNEIDNGFKHCKKLK